MHTVKGFGIVNKAEIVVFLELSFFFNNSTDVGDLISGSSAFSKSSLDIWKILVHVLLKPGLENFEHYFASVWDKWGCAVVWTFFALPFFGIGIKTTEDTKGSMQKLIKLINEFYQNVEYKIDI